MCSELEVLVFRFSNTSVVNVNVVGRHFSEYNAALTEKPRKEVKEGRAVVVHGHVWFMVHVSSVAKTAGTFHTTNT